MTGGADSANEASVPVGVECRTCQYDLRGQSPSGVCPECGTPVWNSLAIVEFVRFSPHLQHRICKGLTVAGLGVAATLLAAPAAGVIADLSGSGILTASPLVGAAALRALATLGLVRVADDFLCEMWPRWRRAAVRLTAVCDPALNVAVFRILACGGEPLWLFLLVATTLLALAAQSFTVRRLSAGVQSNAETGATIASFGLLIWPPCMAALILVIELLASNFVTAILLLAGTLVLVVVVSAYVRSMVILKMDLVHARSVAEGPMFPSES